MPQVLVVNDHKVGTELRRAGSSHEVPSSLLPWLNEGRLAYTLEQIDHMWLHSAGRVITPSPLESHYAVPKNVVTRPRILQLTYYDPGSAAYRYHSALNASGVAVSAFARFGDSNPHSSFRQWDADKQLHEVRLLMITADVVIVHMDYRTLYHGLSELPPDGTRIIRFYHGSVSPSERRVLVENDVDARHKAIQLGARLYHNRFSSKMNWLPIPMPIRDYELESPLPDDGTIRISHSPTVRSNKGTEDLASVVAALKAEGLPIELVLIENKKHGDAIRLKQTCHITFDSFWLGIQGSGLEAGAMGQMVIAGDRSVKDEYTASEVGFCPYTFAGNRHELADVIRRAVEQPSWRRSQARLTNEYVHRFHSYEAVGQRFAGILLKEGLSGTANVH